LIEEDFEANASGVRITLEYDSPYKAFRSSLILAAQAPENYFQESLSLVYDLSQGLSQEEIAMAKKEAEIFLQSQEEEGEYYFEETE